MTSLVLLIYGILLLAFVLASIFVVFHLASYSMDKSAASAAIVIFLIVSTVLILANVLLFLSVPWNTLFAFALTTSL